MSQQIVDGEGTGEGGGWPEEVCCGGGSGDGPAGGTAPNLGEEERERWEREGGGRGEVDALTAEVGELGRGIAQAEEAVIVALGDSSQEPLRLLHLAVLLLRDPSTSASGGRGE